MAGYSKYYVNGKRVPSVTTITGQLGWGKEGLVRWAYKIGASGQDFDEARRGPADAGTIAHAAVEADIRGEAINLAKIDDAMVGTVEGILRRWREWREFRVAEFLLSETELTSETLLYGGRLDALFRGTDGRTWLLDLKTGGMYPDHLVQIAAYALLVEENTEHRVDTIGILRIPRDSETITTLERPFDREGVEAWTFRTCRALYDAHRQLSAEV